MNPSTRNLHYLHSHHNDDECFQEWPQNLWDPAESSEIKFHSGACLLYYSASLKSENQLPLQGGKANSTSHSHKWECMPCACTGCMRAKMLQPCPTLCDAVDHSPPGNSARGILQARILEWVAISSFRESFWPRDQTWVSCIAGRFFTIWATREAQP